VQNLVLQRIHDRIWQPGTLIPTEAELAREFGCARTTVNRALRELAESGILDRKRKAGTRIALDPTRKATVDIPITRMEVENRGARYHYTLLENRRRKPPLPVYSRMNIAADTDMLHIRAVHFSDGRPFQYEDRWVSVVAVPEILEADLGAMSANEWLVGNAAFTHGEIAFQAEIATPADAEVLQTTTGTALFVVRRITWFGPRPITSVRLCYAPGYQMLTKI
jgi:GntR family histidine utilization transcriptional repressor